MLRITPSFLFNANNPCLVLEEVYVQCAFMALSVYLDPCIMLREILCIQIVMGFMNYVPTTHACHSVD